MLAELSNQRAHFAGCGKLANGMALAVRNVNISRAVNGHASRITEQRPCGRAIRASAGEHGTRERGDRLLRLRRGRERRQQRKPKRKQPTESNRTCPRTFPRSAAFMPLVSSLLSNPTFESDWSHLSGCNRTGNGARLVGGDELGIWPRAETHVTGVTMYPAFPQVRTAGPKALLPGLASHQFQPIITP